LVDAGVHLGHGAAEQFVARALALAGGGIVQIEVAPVVTDNLRALGHAVERQLEPAEFACGLQPFGGLLRQLLVGAR
jgi:hypothetical protein